MRHTPASMVQPAVVRGASPADRLIGRSPAIAAVRTAIAQCAPSPISVIITGPSGSGKEVVARAIHECSPRRAKPFIAVNCGAIPAELLESELFGHEKGSFTGATAMRKGRLEDADGGTIFLDEIGDMPFHMQVKLLRVLEERVVQRIGGGAAIPIDVRVISATHRDIEAAIDADKFREDLYYRLAVFPIELPALNERPEDVPLLITHFLAQMHDSLPLEFDTYALRLLEDHGWPGNVRELRNLVQRAVLIHGGCRIGYAETSALLMTRGRMAGQHGNGFAPPRQRSSNYDLEAQQRGSLAAAGDFARPFESPSALPSVSRQAPFDIAQVIDQIERQYILDALDMADGVIAEASRLLGIQRTTLIGKLNKHQIRRPLQAA